MYIRMLVFIVGASLSGCAVPPLIDLVGTAECEEGQECAVAGTIKVFLGTPVLSAVIYSGEVCTKLALPESFFEESSRWDGKPATVKGYGFREPEFNDESGFATFWYQEQDRRVGLGVCDGGVVIYATSLHTESGSIKF